MSSALNAENVKHPIGAVVVAIVGGMVTLFVRWRLLTTKNFGSVEMQSLVDFD
jgi:hypothetical protein